MKKWQACIKGCIVLLFILLCSGESQEKQQGKTIFNWFNNVLFSSRGEKGISYSLLKDNPRDLNSLILNLSKMDPARYKKWSKIKKLAFFINVYNILVINVVVSNYPIDPSLFRSIVYPKNSIMQIRGAFDKITFSVMQKEMTLDYIKNEILRKMKEPRIHMVLVFGANGCPRLPSIPYEGKSLKMWFRFQSKAFLEDSSNFSINRKTHTVHLSELFDWYGEDFINKYYKPRAFPGLEPKENAILNFIAKYANNKDKKWLRRNKKSLKVHYCDFDWTLNEYKGISL